VESERLPAAKPGVKVSFNALSFAVSKNSLIVKILEKCIERS